MSTEASRDVRELLFVSSTARKEYEAQESPHFFSRTHKSPILMEIARRDWKSAARVDHAETD